MLLLQIIVLIELLTITIKVMKKKLLLLSLLVSIFGVSSFAADDTNKQQTYNDQFNHWSIGGSIGMSFIDADQQQATHRIFADSDIEFAGALNIEYTFNPYVGLFLRYNYLPYAGSVSYNGMASDFDGLLHSATINGAFNVTNLLFRCHPQKWDLYTTVGVGYAWYNNSLYKKDTKDEVAQGQVEDAQTLDIPVGAKLEYNLNKRIGLFAEAEYHMFHEDDLESAVKGNSNDAMTYAGIGLTYKFGNKDKRHVRNISWCEYENSDLEERLDKMQDEIDAVKKDVEEIKPQVKENTDKIKNLQAGVDEAKAEAVKAASMECPEDVQSIYFLINSSRLDINADIILADIARKLFENPEMSLTIYGSCDETASEEYNQTLSLKRANTAKNRLVKKFGIDESRIKTVGRGEIKGPKDIFLPNRRVDFVFDGE